MAGLCLTLEIAVQKKLLCETKEKITCRKEKCQIDTN